MDYASLAADIAAQNLVDLDAATVAESLNAVLFTRVKPRIEDRMVNERTMYGMLGPVQAEAMLQALDAAAAGNPIIARVRGWLAPAQGGIDAGNPGTVAQLAMLVAAGVFTQQQSDAFLALGTETVPLYMLYDGRPITADDVRNARAA